MSNSNGSSKLDVTIKLGLVLFVSLLSFAVGTFVGKKFSDNQHKLAQYEGKGAAGQAAHTQPADDLAANAEGSEFESKDSLTDEEIARLAEEFISDDGAPKKTEVAEAGGHDEAAPAAERKIASVEDKSKDAHAADAHTTSAAPAAKAHEEHAAVDTKKTAKPAVEAPAVAAGKVEATSTRIGKYTVQIASYSNMAEAEKMSASLKDKGLTAFLTPAKVNDQTWYRVNVGVYASAAQAKETQKDLDKQGISKTLIQKITE